MPVHTVDTDSLSEIAIHTSQQIQKIEIRIVPYDEINEKLATKHLTRSTKTESLI